MLRMKGKVGQIFYTRRKDPTGLSDFSGWLVVHKKLAGNASSQLGYIQKRGSKSTKHYRVSFTGTREDVIVIKLSEAKALFEK